MINCDVQRLFDLVRYCRAILHEDDLITDDEYAELLTEGGSVDRLHKYDQQQAELEELRSQLAALKKDALVVTDALSTVCRNYGVMIDLEVRPVMARIREATNGK